MIRNSVLIILLLFILQGKVICQVNDFRVSCKFDHSPFGLLVTEIEKQIPVHFLYFPPDMDSVVIHGDFIGESLTSVLQKVLEGTDLHFFITGDHKVIITKGYKIQENLPLGFFERSGEPAVTVDRAAFELFDKQEKNIISQNSLENTVINIGSRSSASTGKANLAGTVSDAETGEPLIGALVYIENPRIGVATDQFGFYSLTIPDGKHDLQLRYIGYRNTRRSIILYGDGTLNIEMVTDVIPLKEVVIESEKDINVAGNQMGRNRIDIQSLKNLPPALGDADILKMALTLPGVQSVGEGANGLNVRGGTVDQNLMLLNEAPLYNPSHLFGFFSALNPDIIRSAELHKGGIEAQYGGRLSSVFEIQTKDGNSKKFVGSGGISPVTTRLAFEGPIIKEKLSYIISGRTTYSNWILKQLPNPAFRNSLASFSDFFGKISWNLNGKNSLYASGYSSSDRFNFNSDTVYNYFNRNATLQWKHLFNNKFYGIFSAIYSSYDYSVAGKKNEVNAFEMDYSVNNYYGKADFSFFPNSFHKIDFGISSIYYDLEPGTLLPYGINSAIKKNQLENEHGLESAIYIGDKYDLNAKTSLYLGFRYSVFNFLGPKTVNQYSNSSVITASEKIGEKFYDQGSVIRTYNGPEFRISARYSMNAVSSLKLGYNRMRQYIHMLSNTTAISPTDTWKLSDYYLKPQIGDQISAGYYRNFAGNTIEASLEAYFKYNINLLDYKNGAELILNDHIETDIVNGLGRSYGLELLLNKKTGKLSGWLTYTCSRSLIKIGGNDASERINNGEYYPASYDKPHSLNVISNWKFSRRFSVSGTMAYSTGRPVTYPLGKYIYYGSERLNYSDRNSFRIPDYFRVDLSVNIEGNHKLKKLNHSSWTLAVYNVTGRDNVYSIYFVSTGGIVKGYRMSIFAEAIPTITYNFRF